jgi:N-acetyl sugar amidotransferase
MPESRPGSWFVDGVCGACRNYEKRKEIDWAGRERELEEVLERFRGERPYDCIIPVSGGKDSHRLVKEMTERDMRPLLVTVNDSFTHTTAGTHNLRNLIDRFNLNHWQYTISHDLFVRATKWAFEQTGEALKFVEYAIYTIPYMLAQQMGIGLVVFGENSAYEYGSTENNTYVANDDLNAMVRKIEGEYEFWMEGGISADEVDTIKPHVASYPLVMYMSYFIPWSSIDNYEIAKGLGFKDLTGEWDRLGTIENFEQIDSQAYMVHLWLKYPKFGFQRVCDIASRRVREGRLELEKAKKLIEKHDPVLDPIALKDFCKTCGYTEDKFWEIVNNAGWNKVGVYG